MSKWFSNIKQLMKNVWRDPKMLLNPKNYISWIAPEIFGYADGFNENPVTDSFNDVTTGENVSANNADILDGLENTLTGNTDFQRQLYLQKYNNSFNAEQAQIARDFNAKENQLQRDFYENMSNTAYQRQVADMRAAGLNPYISMSSGAPVAYGSSASTTAPTATSVSAMHSAQGFSTLANLLATSMNASARTSDNNNQILGKIITSLIAKK